MVRGKYAAKANGQRAESAANAATALRSQLDEERRERAAESAALKAEISSLQGKLMREVRGLAAAEVERVRVEARKTLDRERADRRAAAKEIARVLLGDGVRTTEGILEDLAKLLGFEWGEFAELCELDSGYRPRPYRRATFAQVRKGREQGRATENVPKVALITAQDL